MSDTFAPGPAAQKGGAAKWIIGCGLGCFVLIVIAIVAFVGLGFFAMKEGGKNMKPQFTQAYGSLKSSGKVPADHEVELDELVSLATQPNTSFMGTSMAFGLVMSALEDGQISDVEGKQITDVTALLRKNPEVGFVEAGKFFEAHPDLQEQFKRIQENPDSMQIPKPQPAVAPEASTPTPEAVVTPEAPETPPAPATP